MLFLRNVYKQYKNGVIALNNINIKIKSGDFVYIIGPTGCGKSTIIKLINGEIKPTKGSVTVRNYNVCKLKQSKIPFYRRNIGVIFQDFRLLEKKTVFENVSFALEVMNKNKKEIILKVREVLKLVSLSEKSNCFPSQLSGGEQQRVAIARAIVNNPFLLIADEPTGNLDPKKSKDIVELLQFINLKKKTTIIMVTHNSKIVEKYKKRTIALNKGILISDSKSGGYV